MTGDESTPRRGMVSPMARRWNSLAQLEQSHLAYQHLHLDEQLFQLRSKTAPQARQRVMAGMRISRNVARRNRIVNGPFNLATRSHTRGVAVDEQPR